MTGRMRLTLNEATIKSSNKFCNKCHMELPLAKKEIVEDGGKSYHRHCYYESKKRK